jgi:alkylation response protein AidB-like acyl-CoA dehydrogenase
VDFAFTREQAAFRNEVQSFFRRELTPEVEAEIDREVEAGNWHSPPLEEKLYQTGWLTMHWPTEYGGQGRSLFDSALFNEQIGYFRVPDGAWNVSLNLAGNSIIAFGTDEQKEHFLPWIAGGRLFFCQGFTEPEAGSDLASLKTRATLDGDEFVVNGQKVFTGRAHLADYIYLAVRTDPDVPKHRGLSLLMVDMKSPGVTVLPLFLMGGIRHNQVFFDNVRVPKSNLLGELNQGWRHITTTLAIERSGAKGVGSRQRDFEELVEYVKTASRGDRALAADPYVRRQLADLAIDLDIGRLLTWRLAFLNSEGRRSPREGQMAGVWSKDLTQRLANAALRILGVYGTLRRGSPWTPINGNVEYNLREQLTVLHSGGSIEIQRNILAQRGLGLPR